MINHAIPELDMKEDYAGEMVMPSEKGNVVVEATVRQFIIQARRAYSSTALQNMQHQEDLKLTLEDDEAPAYFGLKIIVQPSEGVVNFVSNEEKANSFFDTVASALGTSDTPRFRGNRAAFIGEFQRVQDSDKGEVLVSKSLVGTTVFYNDYRATIGFPNADMAMATAVESIYERMASAYPDMKIEVSWDYVPDDDDGF